MGEGRLAVLRAIDRHGSILMASKETGISYRRVRGAIRDMEDTIGQPLVSTSRGGKNGGGAVVTGLARELMSLFMTQQKGVQNAMNKRFRKIFR